MLFSRHEPRNVPKRYRIVSESLHHSRWGQASVFAAKNYLVNAGYASS
jgi:hypothetical protein